MPNSDSVTPSLVDLVAHIQATQPMALERQRLLANSVSTKKPPSLPRPTSSAPSLVALAKKSESEWKQTRASLKRPTRPMTPAVKCGILQPTPPAREPLSAPTLPTTFNEWMMVMKQGSLDHSLLLHLSKTESIQEERENWLDCLGSLEQPISVLSLIAKVLAPSAKDPIMEVACIFLQFHPLSLLSLLLKYKENILVHYASYETQLLPTLLSPESLQAIQLSRYLVEHSSRVRQQCHHFAAWKSWTVLLCTSQESAIQTKLLGLFISFLTLHNEALEGWIRDQTATATLFELYTTKLLDEKSDSLLMSRLLFLIGMLLDSPETRDTWIEMHESLHLVALLSFLDQECEPDWDIALQLLRVLGVLALDEQHAHFLVEKLALLFDLLPHFASLPEHRLRLLNVLANVSYFTDATHWKLKPFDKVMEAAIDPNQVESAIESLRLLANVTYRSVEVRHALLEQQEFISQLTVNMMEMKDEAEQEQSYQITGLFLNLTLDVKSRDYWSEMLSFPLENVFLCFIQEKWFDHATLLGMVLCNLSKSVSVINVEQIPDRLATLIQKLHPKQDFSVQCTL